MLSIGIRFVIMNLLTDNNDVTDSGETMREVRSRGGKNKGTPTLQAIASKGNRKHHNPLDDALSYNMGSAKKALAEQVALAAERKSRRDAMLAKRTMCYDRWMTGRYSMQDLAAFAGVPVHNIRQWVHRYQWPPRPIASSVLDALPGEVVGAQGETDVEILSKAAGVAANPDEVARQRTLSVARRKATVLSRNRELADRYHALAMKTMGLLADYAEGVQIRSTVRTVDAEGNPVFTPFYLISKANGFSDGVYRMGMIAEKSIKLDRLAHALENVDGDGNPIKAGRGGLQDPLSGRLTSEIANDLETLLKSLNQPGRLTPVPVGLQQVRVAGRSLDPVIPPDLHEEPVAPAPEAPPAVEPVPSVPLPEPSKPKALRPEDDPMFDPSLI